MKSNLRFVLFAVLLLSATGLALLSSCSLLGSGNTSGVDARVTKLEKDVAANKQAIATLQLQVQQQQASIAALTPATTVVTTPTPAAPTSTTPAQSLSDIAKSKGLLLTTDIVFGNLSITPAQVNIGAAATVSTPVTSNATYKGDYTVVLSVSRDLTTAVVEYTSKLTLNPGETQTVTFTIPTDTLGTFTVTISKKTGAFTVIDPNAPAQ